MNAKEPFQFYTRFNISELTGLKAATLDQLLALLKQVPGSCIYHHTHRFLQQHEHLSPEPPNDFAYWISGVLGEEALGEMIASIDIVQFGSIRSLREEIVSTIEKYLEKDRTPLLKSVRPAKEFHFIKSVSIIAPTPHVVRTLREFADALKVVHSNSLFFHVFEARLRLENKANDFSNWLETSLGEEALAGEISKLDPYTYALEDLRGTIIEIIERKAG